MSPQDVIAQAQADLLKNKLMPNHIGFNKPIDTHMDYTQYGGKRISNALADLFVQQQMNQGSASQDAVGFAEGLKA